MQRNTRTIEPRCAPRYENASRQVTLQTVVHVVSKGVLSRRGADRRRRVAHRLQAGLSIGWQAFESWRPAAGRMEAGRQASTVRLTRL